MNMTKNSCSIFCRLSQTFIAAVTATALGGTVGLADPPTAGKIETIADFGKSVDWNPKLDRIASDWLGEDGYYDVFTMKPDGSDMKILTHAVPGCPQKHNGNPCFHPSGEFLVFTGEDERLPDKDRVVRRVAVPGAGLGANLFVIASDGRALRQLTAYPLAPPYRAVIHPQFSKDGKKLAWSERIRRGDSFGGGWVIKIADFVTGGSPRLTDIRMLTPGEQDCFYETHDFSGDGRRLLLSGNLKRGQAHTGLDIYEMDVAGGTTTRLTYTDGDWDEHAHYSPDGSAIAWMSSTGFDIDYGPEGGRGTTWEKYLKTELWVMDADGSDARQLTHFNTPGYLENIRGARCIVADSAWAPDGRSICAGVAWVKGWNHGVKLVRIELQ
jgi:Tol biopolymer transport system component